MLSRNTRSTATCSIMNSILIYVFDCKNFNMQREIYPRLVITLQASGYKNIRIRTKYTVFQKCVLTLDTGSSHIEIEFIELCI
jgi:hypothetical protein